MKITKKDIDKTIALMLESEEQKKKFREKGREKIINSLEKINVIKKKEGEAKSAIQADANKSEEEKELPSNKKPEEGSVDYEAILALEQLALTFKNNEKAEQIIDGKKITVVDFVGILKGMESASPEFFKACMEKPTIKEVYEKHKDKVNAPGEGAEDSSKVPSDKTGQIKYIQKAVGTKDDGKWGKNTDAKWEEWIVSDGVTKAIEKILGVTAAAPEKETPQKSPTKPETKPEVQKESLNRLGLRNLLETMAYFPYVMNEEETSFVDDKKISAKVDAKLVGSQEKGYTGEIKLSANVKSGDEFFQGKSSLTIKKPGELINPTNIQAKAIANQMGLSNIQYKHKAAFDKLLLRIRGAVRKAALRYSDIAELQGEKDQAEADANKSKKSGSGKKSPPKHDDMGRQGKMGEIAKNRGNAAAIAKMLGFKGTLDGVAKAVAKIKANMPAPVNENRKLFNTLRKYKIL